MGSLRKKGAKADISTFDANVVSTKAIRPLFLRSGRRCFVSYLVGTVLNWRDMVTLWQANRLYAFHKTLYKTGKKRSASVRKHA